jgi:hypothetical protein
MSERIRRFLLGFLIVGSVIFTPIFGTFGPFNNGQSASSTREYFLPAGYAFSIWAVNYIGLIALGIWQALPAQMDNSRARASAPWLAVTAIFNIVWIVLAGDRALVPWTVPTLIIMEVSAWIAYLKLDVANNPDFPRTERFLHIPLQIYVGWLSVATVANTAAALNVLGWDGFGISPINWTVIMLIVSTVLAGIVGWLVKDDNIYRAVFAWAFVGIVVEQRNVPIVALTASIMTIIILLMIVVTNLRNRQGLFQGKVSVA